MKETGRKEETYTQRETMTLEKSRKIEQRSKKAGCICTNREGKRKGKVERNIQKE